MSAPVGAAFQAGMNNFARIGLRQLTRATTRGKRCFQVPSTSINQRRWASDSKAKDLVRIDMNDQLGVATMYMNRAPVNMFDFDFITQLSIEFEKLENDKNVRGVIISSDCPKVFSAGLDINEVYQADKSRLTKFWRTFQDFAFSVYGSRLITISAIGGHAIAGGCVVGLASDYRLMADNDRFKIGLNESTFGILTPIWLNDLTVSTIGQRNAELALQLGILYSPADALKVGYVDKIVPEDELMTAAENEMSKWLKIPDYVRQLTKAAVKKPVQDKIQACREEAVQAFVNHVTQDSIQKGIGKYLESLRKK